MKGPDFLIVGTMKGGTTVLYDFINEHPDVLPAVKKEIHYFTMNYAKGMEWYLSNFPQKTSSECITGEASPTYFDLATTRIIPDMVYRDFPQTKILLIVRDPVERAISHFNHLCIVNKVDSMLNMGAERFFNLPYSSAIRGTTAEEHLLYLALNFSCYSVKYRIYKTIFKDNMLVINNNDLREQPFEVMRKVYQFLGLSDFQTEEFTKIKYSAGEQGSKVSRETRKKLGDFLYPDYEIFCKESGLKPVKKNEQ